MSTILGEIGDRVVRVGDKVRVRRVLPSGVTTGQGVGTVTRIIEGPIEFVVEFTGSEWFYPHRAVFKPDELEIP